MSRPLKVMLVAVEASADTLGAGLIRALKAKLGDAVTFVGVGGAKMAAEGVESPIDIASLSLVGVGELIGAIPRALRAIETAVRLAETEQPDAVVLIDSWIASWHVGTRLRRRMPGVAIIKYVAPQVWVTRSWRARSLARFCDHIMTLFAFEPPYFERVGLPATCVGNPTLSRDTRGADPARLRAELGAAPDDPVLLILPGSRPSEIRYIMPAFEDAAMRLKAERPHLQLVVLAADTVAGLVKGRVAGWPHRAQVLEGEAGKLDAMAAATIALAKSGTVTTELALAGCPMVVGYRVHPLTEFVARKLLGVNVLTLFNIAAGKLVAPEFLQERCTGPLLAQALGALLDDPERRSAQISAQTEALGRLGMTERDPYAAAADVVMGVMRKRGFVLA